ncbi:MAG: HAMP domain-containing histidine kinase [Cyanobacteria bacterium SZAS LIN-5]|nr:HAMP domain-containing histidine kinase [Cyanobacteria bacterium SZAS LIN-5]
MDIKPTSVPELIKKAIDAVAGFAESHNVQVSGEAAEIIVMADEDRVIQVMVNLLSNAIKFSPPGTSVKISAGLVSANGDDGAHSGDLKGAGVHGYCEIQISDRGRGIPADQLPFLFERFRQTEKGDGKRGVGTGLGLAICKAIVEGHEGTIGASSELGKGTTVWLRLPIAT